MMHKILLAYRCRKTCRISNADPQQRVLPETDHTRDFFYEGDAQALMMIGTKGDPIVGHAESQSHSGVPTMRAGDFSVVDIGKRGFHFEQAKGRNQLTGVGDGNAVAFSYAERNE